MDKLETAQFIYKLLDNSFDLLTEEISIPSEIDSNVLHDTLFNFAMKSKLEDFVFEEGDSEGFYYIVEFKNTQKLLTLEEMLEQAHYEYNCAAEDYYRAETEGQRGWGD
jgi:hypothetical protein